MALIHLPFLKGADHSVDPKIAPLGVLKSAKNIRFDREGRIIKRPGFDAHTVLTQDSSLAMSSIKAVFARGAEKVAIGDTRVYSYSPTFDRWRDWNSLSPWSAPERFAVGKNLNGRALRPSVAYANGRICVVFEVLSSTSTVCAAVYDASNMTLLHFAQLGNVGARRPRVVAIANRFVLTYVDASGAPSLIKTTYFNTAGAAGTTWTAPISIITGTALTSDYYDLCAYDGTTALLVHVAAAGLVLAKISFTGTVTGSSTDGGSGVPTVFGDAAQDRVMVAWKTAGGQLGVRSFVTSTLALLGSNSLDVQATHMGQPTICLIGTNTFRVSISQEDAATALDQRVRTWSVDVTSLVGTVDFDEHAGMRIASKTLDLNGDKWFWAVNKSTFDRTYYLRYATDRQPFSAVARGAALDAIDSDAHVSENVSYTIDGRTFALFAAPVIVGQDPTAGTPLTSVDLVRIEYGGTERFQGAVVGGNLYLSGGVTSMFDGALAHEVGFLDAPRIISATPGGGGSMAPSKSYQYLLTHHWIDANGLLHLSGVSDPVTAVLGGGDSSVALKWQVPKQSSRLATSWRDMIWAPDYRVRQHLWRTEGDGQIFHQLTDELGYSVKVGGAYGTIGTATDTLDDAAIKDKAVVYTQGARGALSGPLQHDPPPPCRYIWAGKERVIIGGLETPGEMRWSKFYFTGEALEFSEDTAFRKAVPGSVRGVAMLDDVSLAFTDTQIFTVTGAGPDDTGAGSFDEPKALPSDVGLTTWRSLVEWAGGLFFQGKADLLYLLPRGIGSPQPQLATQEFLRAYPTVTSARLLSEQNLVVFTLMGGVGGTGILLCYDTQNGQWTTDVVAIRAGAGAPGEEYVSSAVVDGRLLLASNDGTKLDAENPSVFIDRASLFVPVSVETAALRPHGMQADGRVRKVGLLGEYRADCSLKMELSVDDSQAFAYSKLWNLGAVAVAGDPLRREWDLPVQKFGACGLRISEVQNGSNANEGFVLHGVTLDTRARPGMPRLKQGFR